MLFEIQEIFGARMNSELEEEEMSEALKGRSKRCFLC